MRASKNCCDKGIKLYRLERRVIEAAILWEAATHRPAAEYMESRADRLSPQKLLEAVQALNKFKGRE